LSAVSLVGCQPGKDRMRNNSNTLSEFHGLARG
jgi:hypothetical protein